MREDAAVGPMTPGRVTIHMVASLDGFIARRDGRVDWLETTDHYAGGTTLDAASAAAFLRAIDCYVMGSRTYETALGFEARGLGWAYGDTPVVVLTNRTLPSHRSTVTFQSGNVAHVINNDLRRRYGAIWVVGGGALGGECLRLGLAEEVRYSIAPVAIGDGIRFFGALDHDVPLHLVEVTAYDSGIVALRYEVRGASGA